MRNLRFLLLSGILVLGAIPPVRAGDLSKVAKVELQPLAAQMQRAGLIDVSYVLIAGSIIAIHAGTVPGGQA